MITKNTVVAAVGRGEAEVATERIEIHASNRVRRSIITATCGSAGHTNGIQGTQIIFTLRIGAGCICIRSDGIAWHLDKVQPIVFAGVYDALCNDCCSIYG